MKKVKCPLFVSDFDGTLVKKNGEVSIENKQAILQYVRDGGIFAVSTGRMPSGIIPQLKSIGLGGLVSCCQGAIIVDVDSGEVLLKGALSQENAVAVCKKLEEFNLHVHIYDLDNFYSNMDDEALRLYERGVGTKAKLVLDKPLSEFIQETNMDVYKILVIVEPQRNAEIYKLLSDLNLPNCTITKSAAYLVEAVNSAYSKGTAVKFLAEKYGIPIEKTIAIGDQWNDLPMIESAGLGIAVKNAAKELQNQSITLAYTNEENAVAHAIEQYAYTEI